MRFPFMQPKEKFLLVEVLFGKNRALLVSLDRDKNIRLEREWKSFRADGSVPIRPKSMARMRIIIVAHPSLAAAISFPIKISRDIVGGRGPITGVELEEFLSGSAAKSFSQCRAEASVKLGVDELNAVLVNSRVNHFTIDGHAVINPVGFNGNIVEAVFELTFAARRVCEDLKELFNSPRGLFFTTEPHAALFALSHLAKLPTYLAVLNAESSYWCAAEKIARGVAFRYKELGWRLGSLQNAIGVAFGLSERATHSVYKRYVQGDISPRLRRHIDRLIKPLVADLGARVKKCGAAKGIYVCVRESPAPLALLSFGAVIDDVFVGRIFEKVGFAPVPQEWQSPEEMFMRLSPLFEYYFDRTAVEIHRKLRRHLQWLSS